MCPCTVAAFSKEKKACLSSRFIEGHGSWEEACPSIYGRGSNQKCTSPKVFHKHCVKMVLANGENNTWNVLFLSAFPLPNWKPYDGGGERETVTQAKHGQKGRPWSFAAPFFFWLLLSTFRDIRIPVSPLLITHSGCKTPLGLAHSPSALREFRNNFFSELLQCVGWQVVESGTAPIVSETRGV